MAIAFDVNFLLYLDNEDDSEVFLKNPTLAFVSKRLFSKEKRRSDEHELLHLCSFKSDFDVEERKVCSLVLLLNIELYMCDIFVKSNY